MTDYKHLFEKTYYNLMESEEVTKLEDLLFDEPLFQACSQHLYSRCYDSGLTPAEIWYIAECFCIELGRRQQQLQTYYPIMLNRLTKTINHLYKGNFVYPRTKGDMHYLIACIDAMLRCSLGKEASLGISKIVSASMKPFYYDDAMSMISYGGMEPGALHILQMPVKTRKNYFEPRPWMLGQKSSTADAPVAEAPEQGERQGVDKQLQAENEQLRNRVSQLETDIEGYKKKEKGMSATEMAFFVTAFCHYNGGLPANGRTSLAPVVEELGGYTETTAVKALGHGFTPELTEKIASAFRALSPTVARKIAELPAKLKAIERERLRKLGSADKVK